MSIHGDAELAALVQALHSYKAARWLHHLSCVGADPAGYWGQQLKEEIKAATRGKNRDFQGRNFSVGSLRAENMSCLTLSLIPCDRDLPVHSPPLYGYAVRWKKTRENQERSKGGEKSLFASKRGQIRHLPCRGIILLRPCGIVKVSLKLY